MAGETEWQEGGNNSRGARFLLALLKILLVVGLVVYILYHLTNGFSSELRTVSATLSEERVTLELTGTVVRAETVIEAGTGAVSYHFQDGERVKTGARVAVLYSGYADSASVEKLAELDRAIARLEASDLDGGVTVADGVAAESEAMQLLLSVSESRRRGELYEALAQAETLLSALSRRNRILSGGEGITAQLAALKAERARVAASLSGGSAVIQAPLAGYFYSSTDGYEGAIDYETVETLTPDAYRKALAAAPLSSGALGKIVRYPKWYLVCMADKETGAALRAGKNYALLFSAGRVEISMRLAAVNTDDTGALLIFSTQMMPENFDFARTQRVSLVTETVSGYKLPASALRLVDGCVGVYVRSGNTIKFRLADVIYENGGAVFVSASTQGKTLYADDGDPANDLYCAGLALYDNVIVSGARELFPDKIVN